MCKFRIVITEYCPFTGHSHTHEVVATTDDCDKNMLWYTSDYGLDCIAYLNEHPEAKLI